MENLAILRFSQPEQTSRVRSVGAIEADGVPDRSERLGIDGRRDVHWRTGSAIRTSSWFAHRRSASVKGYREFFHCPVHHGCRTTELVFRQSDLERPALAPKLGLNRVLDRYMTELAGRFPAIERLVDRTRAAIVHLLGRGARPTLAKVGTEVAASGRTIQRHLEAEGLTYFALVSAVRRQLAERLVTDRQLSLTEIAYLLGFADLSGFRRAYRGWTGEPPATARSRTHASHRRAQRPGH